MAHQVASPCDIARHSQRLRGGIPSATLRGVRRSGPKVWRVMDSGKYLAGTWLPALAAARAQCEAKAAFREDRMADICLVHAPSGASFAIGPHTSIHEVDEWMQSVAPESFPKRLQRTYSDEWRTGSVH